MGLIGAIAIDEVPTASEYNQALRTANVMIDRWSTQRLLLRSTTALVVPLVAGVQSYTIGPVGCAITSAKPIKLYSAFYRDSANVDYPVEVIETVTFNNLTDKALSVGPVMYVSYEPGDAQQVAGKGTINVYLTPDQAYSLHLEVDNYLNEFVNLTDTVTFEPAYYEALIYNLAVRLFRYYREASIPVPMDIQLIANGSLSNLKTMNDVNVIAGMELPGKVSSYNIYSDIY